MAKIRIDLAETLVDGMDIKFKAPCSCYEVTGLAVYYPKEDGTTGFKELVFRDSHGNDLTGIGNLFSKDAYVKVIADTVNGYAYLQNADNNGYLNSAIFGTYTHDAENLIGSGENGKFKATVSGTISSIKVNGVDCSVKCGADTSMDLTAGCWYTFILDGNTVNFNSGGAGASLNFKVVGGTANPVSPSENMIWVNTNVLISGYYFQSEQPENMKPGEVWISTGTVSSVAFSASKKTTVMIYPLNAMQMVGGVLVAVEAKTWQGGKWVDWWTNELYTPGNEWEVITGGWTGTGIKSSSTSSVSAGVPGITREAGKIIADPSSVAGVFHTAKKIDLRHFNYITFTGNFTRGGSAEINLLCGCWESFGTYYSTSYVAATEMNKTSATEIKVNISNVNRECYVGIGMVTGSKAEITSILLS